MEHVAISEVIDRLARATGLDQSQITAVLQAQAELAYELAPRGYPLAGIGVLAMTERPAQRLAIRFGPKQGQEVTVPLKKMLKFRVAKVAKETVLLSRTAPRDVLAEELLEDERRAEH